MDRAPFFAVVGTEGGTLLRIAGGPLQQFFLRRGGALVYS